MHRSVTSPLLFAALASYAFAQTPAPATATPNASSVAAYLLPGETITSISPSQSAKFFADASSFITAYTAAHPLSQLEVQIGADLIFATTGPSGAQISAIGDLVNDMDQDLLDDPRGYVSRVNAIISPWPFANDVSTYEQGLINGLQTLAAQDFSAPVPTITAGSNVGTNSGSGSGNGGGSGSSSGGSAVSTGGVVGARPTGMAGVIGGAVAVAVGVVGVGLL